MWLNIESLLPSTYFFFKIISLYDLLSENFYLENVHMVYGSFDWFYIVIL